MRRRFSNNLDILKAKIHNGVININFEQIKKIQIIATNYKTFECVECANALQAYLISQNIDGKRIKLYTGTALGWDAHIYDDLREETISLNGRHEGIEVIINQVPIIYDNLHPQGLPKTQWLDNLQFDSKLYQGKFFQITEQSF